VAAVTPGCGGDDAQSTEVSGAALTELRAAAQSYRAAQTSAHGEVRVPHVAGTPYLSARHELARAGLSFLGRYTGTAGNPDLPTKCLVVTSQAPAAGTTVPRETQVSGTLGVCPDRVTRLSHRSDWPPWG
jgi:hypothetical protein